MTERLHLLNSRLGHHGLLVLVSLWLFFTNLGGASLWDVDEGRNCGAALEMLETGQYIVPTFNATLRVDKPALLYWLQVLAYRQFGVNEFAARLPSALSALTAVLLAYELGRKLFSPGAGLLGGLILASTPMLCAAARFANPDSLLNMFTVLTLFLFWKGHAARSRWWFVSVGISTGLAVLAKGPVGLVLPAAVIVLFLLWVRQLRRLLDRRLLLGMLAFLLVALPWYVWVAADTKANFLRGFLLTHHVDRFLSPMENHAGSPLYYVLILLAGFAPWSVFLGLALWYAWPGRAGTPDRAGPADGQRFLLCWIAVYVVFFSLAATKLPNYVLPVCPPLALLTGCFLDRWRRGCLAPAPWLLHVSLTGLALIGIGTIVGLCAAGDVLSLPLLHGHTFPGLEHWAALGLLPLLGAALAWLFLRREQRTSLLVSITATAVLFLGSLAAWVSPLFNQYKAPEPLVVASGAFRRDQDIRIGAYQVEYLPSLNFYCQRTIQHQHSEGEVRDFLAIRDLPVYLFVPATLWRDVSKSVHSSYRVIGRHADLYRSGEVLVITNR
jgi:4-amino-4-deoxy-L-arabinose transferase-like glycosyltransferase